MRKYLLLMLLVSGAQPLAAGEELQAPSLANQCGRTHRVVLPIIAKTHRVAAYPRLSKLLSEEGRTWMRVLIGKDGVARDATVIFTSGHKRLDEASIDAIVGKWRWEPPPPECAEMGVVVPVAQNFHMGGPSQFRDPDTLPIYLDNPFYPHDAHEQKAGGAGDAIMRVSNTGETSEIQVAVSTKSPEMDAAMVAISSKLRVLPEPGKEPAERLERITFQFIPHNDPEGIPGLMGPAEQADAP